MGVYGSEDILANAGSEDSDGGSAGGNTTLLLVLAILVIAAVVVGWFVMRGRGKSGSDAGAA
jgi:hypothetical protein